MRSLTTVQFSSQESNPITRDFYTYTFLKLHDENSYLKWNLRIVINNRYFILRIQYNLLPMEVYI